MTWFIFHSVFFSALTVTLRLLPQDMLHSFIKFRMDQAKFDFKRNTVQECHLIRVPNKGLVGNWVSSRESNYQAQVQKELILDIVA